MRKYLTKKEQSKEKGSLSNSFDTHIVALLCVVIIEQLCAYLHINTGIYNPSARASSSRSTIRFIGPPMAPGNEPALRSLVPGVPFAVRPLLRCDFSSSSDHLAQDNICPLPYISIKRCAIPQDIVITSAWIWKRGLFWSLKKWRESL